MCVTHNYETQRVALLRILPEVHHIWRNFTISFDDQWMHRYVTAATLHRIHPFDGTMSAGLLTMLASAVSVRETLV